MFAIDRFLLVGAVLLLVGIASSKLSSRAGLPVLVLFIAVGMLAGSEGIGGIAFENYEIAHALGTVALAVILFDGGLRTSYGRIRRALAPALTLATVGVLATAAITGLAARLVLGVSLLEGLLLGSIVASTDAAAVFATLRSSGVSLPDRLASTLEVESGSNDPMAVFLTVGLIQVLLGNLSIGGGLAGLFMKQMVIGCAVGLVLGRLAVEMINRIDLRAAGLYPVLTAATGLLTYGLAATLGGSGFLSVYLAGVVLGSHQIVFQRGILLFHDGAAWLAQIGMFVLLGLLSFPSRLLTNAIPALVIAAVLILVARPIAVALSLTAYRFGWREQAVVSVAGLKGAVPIVLATYPLLLGLAGGETMFDVVFFVVIVSALAQGVCLPAVSRALGFRQPVPAKAPVSLEITSLKNLKGDIVDYTIEPATPIVGQTVRELGLPDEAVIAMVLRGDRILAPRGSTRIRAGDHLFIVAAPEVRTFIDDILIHGRGAATQLSEGVEFPLRGSTTLADLKEIYGIDLEDEDPDHTLDELIRSRLRDQVEPGDGLTLGPLELRVREIADGSVESVGLVIRPPASGLDESDDASA